VSLISAGDLPFAAPTGTRLNFLACPPDVAARAFVTAQAGRGHACHLLDGPSEDVTSSLARLHPLSFLGQRHLFLPTASPGWTAYVNNYQLGTNAHSVMPELARTLGCRTVLIEAVPHGTNGEASEALGLTILATELPTEQRSVGLRNHGGFWRFWQLGFPLPFEDVSRYRFRSRKRRFDLPLLTTYAAALDLHPFQPQFYRPGGLLVTCGAPPSR